MGTRPHAVGTLFAALAAPFLLAACGSGPAEDLAESLRDDDAATAYVLEGTLPEGVEAPDGVPGDRPGRIGWILARPGGEDDSLRLGVRDAVAAEPDVLADLVVGVADAGEPLSEGAAETVLTALGAQSPSVLAAAGGPEPDDAVALDGDALLDTLALAGAAPGEDGFALTQPLLDVVVDGLLADLQPASGLPEEEWAAAVAAADEAWAQPAARVWGSIARAVCAEDAAGERCEVLLERLVDQLDPSVDQVVYETAPPEVLPAPLLLSGEREPLTDVNRGAWDGVLDGVGLDVAADIRSAAGAQAGGA